MTVLAEREVRIAAAGELVSGLAIVPKTPRACYVVAHGAGAGMRHHFMSLVAQGLAARGVATLRYQFPYMERGLKRPDSPKLAHATVRAAVAEAAKLFPALGLIAGGKSFGGRMTSQAQAETPLEGVRALAFLGFPLHPPGQASAGRGEHLLRVNLPMLFLQGTRDDFAQLTCLQPLLARIGSRATLKLFDEADHSFHMPARSGRKDADVMSDVLDALAGWVEGLAE